VTADVAWDRMWEVFHAALERVPAERADWIERECGGDVDLRRRVERLLAAHETNDDFLEPPPRETAVLAIAGAEPERVPGFTIQERIGEGGFADVWLAEQTEPVRRRVALKVLKPGMDSRRVIARFQAEEQTLASLDHPSIARVYDAGMTEAGRPWFAMEYIAGPPITSYCDRRGLSVRARLDLFLQACRAVQHAHEKGVIHRDLKPSNILVAEVDGAPLVKVIDFGIAKAIDPAGAAHTVLTEQGQLVGTPAYMSPEQATLADVDTRSDVYGLGVLLYELVSGVLPFDERRLRTAAWAEIQRILREEEPQRPSTRLRQTTTLDVARQRGAERRALLRQVRGDLDWIVMKAMDKDRDRRFASASELAADVERHLRHEPVLAGPPGAAYRARKFLRRHRVGVTFSVAALLVLVAAAIHFALVARREEGLRRDAEEARTDEAKQRALAEARQREAERSARLAEAVNLVLREDIIGALDPRRASRPDITLLEAVDAAAQSIGKRFADEPLAEAAARRVLGDTYRSLGKFDSAVPALERAVALFVEHCGEDDVVTQRASNDLAILYRTIGRYADAEKIYRQAIEVRTRTLGADHRETLMSRVNHAALLSSMGRNGAAARELVDCLAAVERVLGKDHEDAMLTRQHLGSVYLLMKRHEDAAPLLRAVYEHHERVSGPDHPYTIAAGGNLAQVLEAMGRAGDAESLFVHTLEAHRRRLGDDHAETAVARFLLGQFYMRRKDYAQAEPLLLAALAKLRASLGEAHATTITAANYVGNLYDYWGRQGDAEPHYGAAADAARLHLPKDSRERGLYILNHGRCLRRVGRLEDAEPRLLEGLAITERVGAAAPDQLRDALTALGHLYTALGRADQVEVYKKRLNELR
jgi:non-specific serine/threonine protein kinase/serine/threonine-protein kinase